MLVFVFKVIGKLLDVVFNGKVKNSNKVELKVVEIKDGSYCFVYDVMICYIEFEFVNWEVLVDVEIGSILK